MKARWLTLFASVPLIVGTMLLQSCGGVGGPTKTTTTGGGGNGPTANFLALLTAEQKASKYIGPEACAAAACHGGTPSNHVSMKLASFKNAKSNATVYDDWKGTEHYAKGVTCENCHGPGGAHQAAPKNADGTAHAILTFPKVTSPEVCGQCHGPIHDDWAASGHANLITSPISSTVTNPASNGQTSRCFMCHGGLTRAEFTENGIDPSVMTAAQITQCANDILNTVPYIASCATCHNPHKKTGNLNTQGEDVQLYHPEANTDSTAIAPGTTPVQYTAANQLCGQCHNGRGTTATDAYLTANASRPSAHHSNQFNSLLGVGGAESPSGPPQRTTSHAQIDGQCAHCHMPQSRHTYTVSVDNGCAPCHTPADVSARAAALKNEVVNGLTALANRMGVWANKNLGDSTFWDYTSNIAAGKTAPAQSKIPIEVKRARHNYYYIVISGDYGVHNAAYTRYLIQWSNDTLTNAGIPKINATEVNNIPMAQKLEALKQVKKNASSHSIDD